QTRPWTPKSRRFDPTGCAGSAATCRCSTVPKRLRRWPRCWYACLDGDLYLASSRPDRPLGYVAQLPRERTRRCDTKDCSRARVLPWEQRMHDMGALSMSTKPHTCDLLSTRRLHNLDELAWSNRRDWHVQGIEDQEDDHD